MTLYLSLAIAGIALQVLDFISTRQALDRGALEGNPLINSLMSSIGIVPALLVAKVIGALSVALLYWLHDDPDPFISAISKVGLVGVVILYTFIVRNNFKLAGR